MGGSVVVGQSSSSVYRHWLLQGVQVLTEFDARVGKVFCVSTFIDVDL